MWLIQLAERPAFQISQINYRFAKNRVRNQEIIANWHPEVCPSTIGEPHQSGKIDAVEYPTKQDQNPDRYRRGG